MSINHLYFDCGDGRTITVFTSENRKPAKFKNKNELIVHHVAIWVSKHNEDCEKINDNKILNTGIKDRGFMDYLYFKDADCFENSCYKFEFRKIICSSSEKAHELRLKELQLIFKMRIWH